MCSTGSTTGIRTSSFGEASQSTEGIEASESAGSAAKTIQPPATASRKQILSQLRPMNFPSIQEDLVVQIGGVNPEPAPGSGVRTLVVRKIKQDKQEDQTN